MHHACACVQATRAGLDCSFFKNFPLFSGVAGSASCLRYDALWYAVSPPSQPTVKHTNDHAAVMHPQRGQEHVQDSLPPAPAR